MNSVRMAVLGAVITVAAAGMAQAQSTVPSSVTNKEVHDLRRDRRDVVQDNHELKRDSVDLRTDRRELRRDVNQGHLGQARRDYREIHNDRQDTRIDAHDRAADKRDVRRDRRAIRDSIKP